jgi:hypothetical protein
VLRDRGPLTDGDLRRQTGIEPHQQVNQICRRLEDEGVLRRERRSDGRIHNVLVRHPSDDSIATLSPNLTSVRRTGHWPPRTPTASAPIGTEGAAFVIPCSGWKVRGGSSGPGARPVVDLLPDHLAQQLVDARRRLAAAAKLDESLLLPASERYNGWLYQAAEGALQSATKRNRPVIIISGGYGLVMADDLIGWYDRRFSLRDWPRGLLEDCLVELVRVCGAQRVLALCARTTDYAELVRRIRWKRTGLQASLSTVDMGGKGGARRAVPFALGEAFSAALAGKLTSVWQSAEGLPVVTEALS